MSRQLHVDRAACAGHGLCYGTAPELLDSDEQGDPVIITDPVPDELVDSARHAVDMCPERALALSEQKPPAGGQSRVTAVVSTEESNGRLPREARIRRALEHLRAGTTDEYREIAGFTAAEFTDPAIAARERELVFGRVPSIVAHGSELPESGDFITLTLPRNNAILVRQKDGTVKAFVNLCRHRGALLEERDAGRCRLFSCGYHRWSYDTDGALRTVTRGDTFGEFDKSGQGLIELPCQERHGFVWMIDNASADIDVAQWLGPEMDEILADYQMAELVAFQSEGFDEPVNWKIMQDAFLDGYHIQYAHPNTAAKHIHTNVLAFEDFGRHCRFIAPRKTIDRWLEEDPGDRSLANYITETHFLLPNSTLLRQPDHFQLLTFRPHRSDPGRCRMEMRLIVPKLGNSGMDEEKWTRVWSKNWDILLSVLHQEDFPLLRGSQLGMQSADAGPMLLGRNEVANHVYRRELRNLTSDDRSSACGNEHQHRSSACGNEHQHRSSACGNEHQHRSSACGNEHQHRSSACGNEHQHRSSACGNEHQHRSSACGNEHQH